MTTNSALSAAARGAVHRDIKKARAILYKASRPTCPECDKFCLGTDLEMHHAGKPFRAILKEFIEENGTPAFYKDNFGFMRLTYVNERDAWVEFHRQHFVPALICHECHVRLDAAQSELEDISSKY